MKYEIEEILSPISSQIDNYELLLQKTLATDSVFIYEITRHLFAKTGKRLRPGLLFLAAGNVDKQAVILAGVAIELIHVATLLHDDVIDQSDKRRGQQTVNARWSNLVSVLMGDYLFAKSFALLVQAGVPELLSSFSQATERVAKGELNQVYFTGNFDLNEDEYLKVISDKTASLMSCAAEAGMICADGDRRYLQAMKNFGEYLGMAFQITDDILDLVGESTKTGKQLGSDIREGWATLPLIYALRNGGRSQKDRLIKLHTDGFDPEEFMNLVEFIREEGGIDYADRKARDYSRMAKDIIMSIPGLEYQANLCALADFAVARNM